MKKITEYLNLLLRTRGEEYEYSEADVGRILSHHGFRTNRIGSGIVLRFSSERKQLLHQLVRKFGLDLPRVPGCSHCAEPEANVPAVVQDV